MYYDSGISPFNSFWVTRSFFSSFREFHLRIPSINPFSRVSTSIHRAKSASPVQLYPRAFGWTSGNVQADGSFIAGSFADGTWLNSIALPFSKGVGWLGMQKWEGIKEYYMVGGEILGSFVLVFFCYYFLWVSAGWYIFKLFYQSTFNDPQKQFSVTWGREMLFHSLATLLWASCLYLTVGRSFHVVNGSFHVWIPVTELPFPHKTTLVLEV